MDYERTLATTDSKRLVAVIGQLLVAERFKLGEPSGDGLTARRRLGSVNNHDPFCGISRVELTPLGREVQVRADYGHLRWVRNFLLIFLPGPLLLSVLFGHKQPDQGTMKFWFSKVLLYVLALVMTELLMMWSFRRQSVKALDGLVRRAEAAIAPLPIGGANAGTPAASPADSGPPFMVRADYEKTIDLGAASPARALQALRGLISHTDFRFGETTREGFKARKTWIGLRGREELPFIASLAVTAVGHELRVQAELSRASLRLIWWGLLVLSGGGIGCLLYFTHRSGPNAINWAVVGLGLSAPELILLMFLPALLRQWARGRLDKLVRMAANLAQAGQ